MQKASSVLFMVLAMAACTSAAILGGESAASAQEPGVQAAANYILTSANTNACNGLCAGLNKEGELTSVEVKSATHQVVAGTLYKLELVVTNAKQEKFDVKATVWSRPWLEGKNGAEPATQVTHLEFKKAEGPRGADK